MTKGFSLIEIVIVLALFAFIASLGTLFSTNFVSASYALSERDLIVSLLTQVRAKALANVHETPHSLFINTDAYVLYEGTTYSTSNITNVIIPKISHATVGGLQTVTFAQLTADVVHEGSITVAGDTKTYTITINSAGRINW